MMHLEVRHLLLVQAVADEGNLTRAGTRLNLTQSALSHQLLDLEQRLGTRIFHRVGKKMVLTNAGERVLRSASRILEELQKTEEDVRLLAAEKRGLIRLTTECYTCYHWLPALLAKFAKKHPGVDVRIDAGATKNAVESLIEGKIDLAIISSEIADKRVRLTDLFDDEMVAVMSVEHELASRDFLTPRELASQNLLVYRSLEESTAYTRVLRPAGLEPAGHMVVPLSEAMVELARGGIGVAVMARWSVWPQIEARAVAAVPVTRRGLHRKWRAAVLASDDVPAYLDEFIEMLAAQPAKQRDVPVHVPRKLSRV
jgi:LysR family transcriptional regulator for metE and metH